MHYAVIIPARDEEESIGLVLAELRAVAPALEIVVGVNASTDATPAVARAHGALVAETGEAGYGYGCQAAIAHCPGADAYIFLAADGANDPRDIAHLIAAHAAGHGLVLGTRTTGLTNWSLATASHILANRLLGAWCGLLTGRFFTDLGPLRLIDGALFDRMALREWTYGWTIEAQIRAVQLGARIVEIPVRDRGRLAGRQKVSGVSLARTLRVGAAIFAAGWRTRWACQPAPRPVPDRLAPFERNWAARTSDR